MSKRRQPPRIYAAKVLIGEISIEDVPEMQQRAVDYLIERCGPAGKYQSLEELIVELMRRVELERKQAGCR